MKKLQLVTLLLAISLFFASCSKEGDLGPVGPVGPTGITGPAGPQGPVGNPNVQIDTFRVSNAQWIYGSTFWFATTATVTNGFTSRYFDRAIPRLTSNYIQNNLVLVYFTPSLTLAPLSFLPAPYSFYNSFGKYYLNIAFEELESKMRLHFYFNEGANAAPSLSTYIIPTYKFKIITVDGNITGRNAGPKPDYNDYAAVCKYYGIEE